MRGFIYFFFIVNIKNNKKSCKIFNKSIAKKKYIYIIFMKINTKENENGREKRN